MYTYLEFELAKSQIVSIKTIFLDEKLFCSPSKGMYVFYSLAHCRVLRFYQIPKTICRLAEKQNTAVWSNFENQETVMILLKLACRSVVGYRIWTCS